MGATARAHAGVVHAQPPSGVRLEWEETGGVGGVLHSPGSVHAAYPAGVQQGQVRIRAVLERRDKGHEPGHAARADVRGRGVGLLLKLEALGDAPSNGLRPLAARFEAPGHELGTLASGR